MTNQHLRLVLNYSFGFYLFLYLWTALILITPFFVMRIQTDIWNNAIEVTRGVITFFASALLMKYFFYMMISPWYDRVVARKKQLYPDTEKPKVSVVIPAWNEEVDILGTVESVLANTYENVEVIVINDGSTDGSDALMRAYEKKYARKFGKTKKLIYTYIPNGGKGNALNTGIALSSGDIIVTIDADCIVDIQAIEHFVGHFRDPQVMALVGNVKIGSTKSILGMIQYLEFLFSFYFKKADSLLNTIYIIGGAAGAFRRTVFEQLGGYDTACITEDIELSVRIQKAGMKIAYAADALVYTEGAADFNGLLQQRLRWKRGRFDTFSRHRDMFFSLKKGQNKLLTYGILPFAVFGDIQLYLELCFIFVLYLFAFVTHDFSLFVSGIGVVAFMFFIQMLFDETAYKGPKIYLLAPIGWLLFYLTTFVEVNALFRSMLGVSAKQQPLWQHWKRVGVLDSA